MSLFSVVIPTFNRLDLLRQTLDSVRLSEEGVAEIIVVDDGSTDGTVDFLRQNEPGVILIKQANQGPGAARNRGIEAATGDYVAFLDSDDLWFPWTSRVYRQVIEGSGADLIFGNPHHFKIREDLEMVPSTKGAPDWISFEDYYKSGDEWRWWGASSFVVLRNLLARVRFVEYSVNGEDADFVMKLGNGVALAQIVGGPTFAYREHAGSVMKNLDKTVAGAWNLARSENAGNYPGGRTRQNARRRILGRHLRPVIIELLKSQRNAEGWKLFCETLPWHLHEHRWRFIAASVGLKIKP